MEILAKLLKLNDSTQYALRLFHTVRHLRIIQIVYRLYYRWRCLNVPPLAASVQARVWAKAWHSPQWQRSCTDADGQFNFLNNYGRVDSHADWNNTKKPKLWLYNLHYLDELNTIDADDRVTSINHLIDRWIDGNPAPFGNGWEPYPVSMRLVNLIKWQRRQHHNGTKLLNSIQQQAIALSRQVEHHIMANHLFSNGKALVFAGAALEGGDKLLQQGLRILDKEIPEQFLIDGGHFELSPMYHSILLWDMCDLVNLAKTSAISELQTPVVAWVGVIERGLVWLAHMSHPDGDVAFFNDSTMGIAPRYADLCQYAAMLGITTSRTLVSPLSVMHLHESGYIIGRSAEARLIMDVGKVGPEYQPGHAHADLLSFELSLFRQRVFVNSGISQYGVGVERSYQRSTEAHNTVLVDGKNSSDVWGGFRVGRRAIPNKPQVTQSNEQINICCSHGGYSTLFNPLIHTRQCLLDQQSCQFIDTLSGDYQQAQARYHLHPDIKIQQLATNHFHLKLSGGEIVIVKFSGCASVRIEEAQWHPGFNRTQPNCCLVTTFKQHPLHISITW